MRAVTIVVACAVALGLLVLRDALQPSGGATSCSGASQEAAAPVAIKPAAGSVVATPVAPQLPPPYNCTAEETAALASWVPESGYDMSIGFSTSPGCPGHEWWPAFAARAFACQDLTVLDVGANKGYLLAGLLDVFAPELGIYPASLHPAIQAAAAGLGNVHGDCGICDDCKDGPLLKFVPRACPGGMRPQLSFHAWEPMNANLALLRDGLGKLVASKNSPRVTLNVHHFAGVGDKSISHVDFGECPVGAEGCGIVTDKDGGGQWGNSKATLKVPASTLDAWADAQGIQRFDVLCIDAEGMDPEVLRGAEGLLRAGRVRLLEFEYHKHRAWRDTSLQHWVTQLSAWGMDCYLLQHGRVIRLTGCWADSEETREWTNIMCARRDEAAIQDVLQSFLPRTARPAA